MLKVRNVFKTYQTNKISVQALKDVSLDFDNTGLYFILGKSGSGKSTLLNLIGGLDNVTTGDIVVDNNTITQYNLENINQYRNYNVGFIFQEFNLISNLNVKENIAISLRMQGKKPLDEEINHILEMVELKDCIYRKVNELSGGQKQRVAIARAIIKNPKIILADEPTGALDSETSNQIFTLLKKLSKDRLVIVVSHDEEYARKYADEIIFIRDGIVAKIEKINCIETNTVFHKEIEKKNSLPFLTSFKIGLSNLKINVIRLCILIILSVISFCCLGVAATAFQYDKTKFVVDSIAADDYLDPLSIIAYEKRNNSISQQSIVKESLINDINTKFDVNYVGEYQNFGKSNRNFLDDISIDYSKTYDALSLFAISGLTVFSEKDINHWNFNVHGSYPIKANEIMITRYFYETFKKYGYKYKDTIIKAVEVTEDVILGKIIEIPKYSHSDILIEYKITGIVDTKINSSKFLELNDYNASKTELSKMKELINCYQKSSLHSVGFVSKSGLDEIYCYDKNEGMLFDSAVCMMPRDKKKILNIMNYLNNISDDTIQYNTINTTNEWIEDVNTLMNSLKIIGEISGIILFFFSGLLLFNFINLSISHKKKEMGILRALGASGFDVFKIFSIEGFLIAVINSILSIIGTGILINLINNKIQEEFIINVNAYSYTFITIILIIVVSFLSCFLSIFVPVLKVSRKTPIEAIIE